MPLRIPVAPGKVTPIWWRTYPFEILALKTWRMLFVIRLISGWYYEATNLVTDGRALHYDGYHFGDSSIRALGDSCAPKRGVPYV